MKPESEPLQGRAKSWVQVAARFTCAALVLLVLALACGKREQRLRDVPVVFGDQPANDEPALVGSWRARKLHIASTGTITGRLDLELDEASLNFSSIYTDVLCFQVRAVYIYPTFGDMMSKPASEFIVVVASHSTAESAVFDLNERFDVPPLQIDIDGGMPLHQLQVRALWYRFYRNGYYHAKVGYPGELEDGWKGKRIIDRISSSLHGTLDTNVGGGPPDDQECLPSNVRGLQLAPATVPAYPQPSAPPVFTSPLDDK